MNVSSASIRNPVPAVLLFILLTLAGLLAYRANKVQDFPDIELPMVTVDASLPGAAPAQLETEVARKLENTIATLQGVKHQYVRILDGVVSITVEFVLEKNASDAVNEVRDAVSRVRADMPADLRDPAISKVSTAGRPVMVYAARVSSNAATKAPDGSAASMAALAREQEPLSWYIDNDVTRRLLNVPGVGAVRRLGGVAREVTVSLRPDAMQALGVTAADVSRLLRQVQQESPGGRGDIGGQEQSVRTIATVQSAQSLANLQLPLGPARQVRLSDVAEVRDGPGEQRALALLDGQPVVGFEVLRTRGAGETEIARAVARAVDELNQQQARFHIETAVDNAWAIEENFRDSINMLYEGAILAVIVVFWFLRDWRSTLVSAVALPLSILPAFLGLYWFEYTLNTVTLTAIGLVVGVLVDDAIVEVENINRHLLMGKSPFQAAMEAADEIGMAVIATTLALVAVFLPMAFMAGVPGKFFKQFGWAAVLAIVASLLVARMLTPMMSAYWLKPKAEHSPEDGWVMRRYLGAVQACMRHRWLTLAGAALFFVGSLFLSTLLPSGFVPPADRAQTIVNVELPPGSTLRQTLAAAEQARQALATLSDVKSVFSSIGGGSSGDVFAAGATAEARRAVLTVTLSHRQTRGYDQQHVESLIRERLADLPGVRLSVGPQDSGVKLQLVLRSDHPQALVEAATALERDLRTLKGVGNISSSASLVRPEVVIRPDPARAADLGVTTAALADTLRIATAGDYDQNLAKLNLADRQLPIRVKFPTEMRANLDELAQLSVPARHGSVYLHQIADLQLASGPAQIDRLDRSRNVTLEVELAGRPLGEVNAEALALPSLQNLPPGVYRAELGDAQEMVTLFTSFLIAMGIGVLCIYMVLVMLFHNFLQPFTILGALPLSIGGAFVLMLLCGQSLSMPSMIGLVMLMGIVTKNSILLVDYVVLARQAGQNRHAALVDACHKRARPIIMTTIAMGAGMMPAAIGLGGDPSFRAPMAIAVIGGLITSTLLSLLVVPAAYTVVDDLQAWFQRRLRRTTRHAPT